MLRLHLILALSLILHGGFAADTPASPAPATPVATGAATVPPGDGATAAVDNLAPPGKPGWPRRFVRDGHTVIVYQPQPEKLDGNTLTARAAIAVATGDGEPVFGAEWFTARLDIDRSQRIAQVESLTIDRVRFPAGEAGDQAAAVLADRVSKTLTPKDMSFDLDHLVATLEQKPADATAFNHKPPRILVRTTPTELLVLDGDPVLEAVSGDGAKRLVNTPALVWVDGSGAWWLRLQDDWLTAPGLDGPWTFGSAPSAIVADAKAADIETGVVRADTATAPAVVVAREPTAVVQFNGVPAWTPIGDTGILAADNCDCDAYIDTATQRTWLVLAGRWYWSDHLADDATWTYTAPSALPPAFANIPAQSRWGQVRTQIAGTPEAREAALDAQVPQTARIPRSATLAVTYDGEPQFATIPASDTAWATNSAFAVFRTPGPDGNPLYWCCADAVWYQAPAPTGPWTVATEVPAALHQIPPENPDHAVSYVYVYDSDPDVVWEGYTGGYNNAYIEDGCPIYGTGWYWPGYYRHGYRCPRPLTWGLRVGYDPWTCAWGLGLGINDHFSIAFSSAHDHDGEHRHGWEGGWWGATGHPPEHIERPGQRPPPPGYRVASAAIEGPHDGHIDTGHGHIITHAPLPSIYARIPNAHLPAGSAAAETRSSVIRGNPDQIFVEPNGTVVRRGNDGVWQERRNGSWGTIDFQAHPAPAADPGDHPSHAEPARIPPVQAQAAGDGGHPEHAEPERIPPAGHAPQAHPVPENRPGNEERPQPAPHNEAPAPQVAAPPATIHEHEETPFHEQRPVGPLHAETPAAPPTPTPTLHSGPAFPTVPPRELELNRAFDERERGSNRTMAAPTYTAPQQPQRGGEPQRGGDPNRH